MPPHSLALLGFCLLFAATSWAQEGATSPSRQVSDTQWRVKAKEGSWVLACPAGIASDSTTVGEPIDKAR